MRTYRPYTARCKSGFNYICVARKSTLSQVNALLHTSETVFRLFVFLLLSCLFPFQERRPAAVWQFKTRSCLILHLSYRFVGLDLFRNLENWLDETEAKSSERRQPDSEFINVFDYLTFRHLRTRFWLKSLMTNVNIGISASLWIRIASNDKKQRERNETEIIDPIDVPSPLVCPRSQCGGFHNEPNR